MEQGWGQCDIQELRQSSVNMRLYLSQGVPVCDGLPWVSQHFVPVISSKTLSVRPGVTHADHLIVSHPVGRETRVNTHLDAHNEAVHEET